MTTEYSSLPLLVAEIGINHNGSVELAQETISMVYDAVEPHYPTEKLFIKFQKRNPDLAVPPEMWNTPRKSLRTGQWTNYITYKRETEFSVYDYIEIDNYIKYHHAGQWFVSVWDIDSVKWVEDNFPKMPYVKIPSAHLTNKELLLAASELDIPMIISTGMSTREEVFEAFEYLHGFSSDVIGMICNSSYPCADEETDLNSFADLYEIGWHRFGAAMRIGFSSHSPSPFIPIYSNFFNPYMIEFHVTLDRTMEGSDHSASLEKNAIELLARETSRIPVVRGSHRLTLYESEMSKRRSLRGE